MRTPKSYLNEIVAYQNQLRKLKGKNIVVFGSARDTLELTEYDLCTRVCHDSVRLGCNVITGGGPGIMQAANVGAFTAKLNYNGKQDSVGINIALPNEQEPNKFQSISTTHEDFTLRNRALFESADLFLVFGGGFGTMYELFGVLTEMQCDKIRKSSIIVCNDKLYYSIYQLVHTLNDMQTICVDDKKLLKKAFNYDDIMFEIKSSLFCSSDIE